MFPSSTQTSNFPPRNGSLISHEISTFLMISFDYDKLLNAVIYFSWFPRYIFSTVDLCVYTSDKHFVRSRFILIVPLCQRLLMIFCCTFTQCFTTVSFKRHTCWNGLETDQTGFSSPRKLMITQSVLKLSPVFEKSKRLEGLFCISQKMFSLFTPAPDLNKLPCASSLMQNTVSLFSQAL